MCKMPWCANVNEAKADFDPVNMSMIIKVVYYENENSKSVAYVNAMEGLVSRYGVSTVIGLVMTDVK